ncbi:MAG: hypothetical protein Q4A11_01675 [Brachymonas sp.]|nr:hypothetical protein [Brachymonas sp.]
MNKNGRKMLFSPAAALAAPSAAGHITQAPQPWVSEAEANWWRYGSWLTGVTLLLCALALCLPSVPVPDSYHAFADQVTWWGFLPHARDVLSNAAFALAGWALLWQGRRYVSAGVAHKRVLPAVYVAGWGLVLTAVCSGVYHLQPDARGLVLDRLGMSVAFAGVLGLLVADRFAPVRVLPAMTVALLLGVACTLGDFAHNNTMPWVLFQLGLLGLMLLAPWITRSQGAQAAQGQAPQAVLSVAWWQVLVFYVLAKVCEMGDQAFWQLTGEIISGHSLKHIVAAAAVWPVLQALRARVKEAHASART